MHNITKKKLSDFNGLLFDLDGTLIDTAELIYQSFYKTVLEFKNIKVEKSSVLNSMGLPLVNQLKHLLESEDIEKVKSALDFYKEFQISIFAKYIKIFPDIEKTLQKLKEKNKKMAVVTSRLLESAVKCIDYFNLQDYFSCVITPDLTEKHKPNPDPALKACEMLQIEPCECLFIGDASYDILCGSKAGNKTCFVSYSRVKIEDLPIKPDYVIDDINKLI